MISWNWFWLSWLTEIKMLSKEISILTSSRMGVVAKWRSSSHAYKKDYMSAHTDHQPCPVDNVNDHYFHTQGEARQCIYLLTDWRDTENKSSHLLSYLFLVEENWRNRGGCQNFCKTWNNSSGAGRCILNHKSIGWFSPPLFNPSFEYEKFASD